MDDVSHRYQINGDHVVEMTTKRRFWFVHVKLVAEKQLIYQTDDDDAVEKRTKRCRL